MSDSPAAIQRVRSRIIEIAEKLNELYDMLEEEKCPNRRQREHQMITLQAEMNECRRIVGFQVSINVDGATL